MKPGRRCKTRCAPATGEEKSRGRFEALFSQKRPCSNCPFLKNGAIELAPGRLEGIVAEMLADDWTTFSCHKHVHHPRTGGRWSDDGEYAPSGREAHCMGAMAYLQKVGRPNVPMRLGYLNGTLKLEDVVAIADEVIETMELASSGPEEAE